MKPTDRQFEIAHDVANGLFYYATKEGREAIRVVFAWLFAEVDAANAAGAHANADAIRAESERDAAIADLLSAPMRSRADFDKAYIGWHTRITAQYGRKP